MGLTSNLTTYEAGKLRTGLKEVTTVFTDAFLSDLDQRVTHSGLASSTIQRVRKWLTENNIASIGRFKFGSNEVIMAAKVQLDLTAEVMLERKEPWIVLSYEDVTYSVTGLQQVAEVYNGAYNLLMRTDDNGKWKGTRLPGQDVPQSCVGETFTAAQDWGGGSFNRCAGFSPWRSPSQLREEAGVDASFQNRAAKAAFGFGLIGPITSIGAFFSPELHLGALKMGNGPQALSCPAVAIYAAYRAKTGQRTMVLCCKDNIFDFSMAVGEDDVRKHCEDVLVAVRDDVRVFVG